MSRGSTPETEQKCSIFRVKKVRKNVHFFAFFAKNDAHPPTGFALKLRKKWVWLHPAKQPGKRVYKGGCHPGKNPPIYTVLNAAFLRHPPTGGHSAQSALPAARAAAPGWTTPGKALLRLPQKKIFLNFFLKNIFL